jgi:hypothetical protein
MIPPFRLSQPCCRKLPLQPFLRRGANEGCVENGGFNLRLSSPSIGLSVALVDSYSASLPLLDHRGCYGSQILSAGAAVGEPICSTIYMMLSFRQFFSTCPVTTLRRNPIRLNVTTGHPLRGSVIVALIFLIDSDTLYILLLDNLVQRLRGSLHGGVQFGQFVPITGTQVAVVKFSIV